MQSRPFFAFIKPMQLVDYIPVLIQILLALGIAILILLSSYIFGQRTVKNAIKDSPYECGMLSEGSPHPQFAIKFYITAMLFVIFDIEIVFLIPWALIYRDFIASSVPIFLPILCFLLVLSIGLIYELKKGALEWRQ